MAEQATTPKLSKPELKEAQERSSVTVRVVYEAVRREGEDELKRTLSALAWSGLAAGLSMGFSLMIEGVLRASLPNAPWSALISKFGYSAGFVIVILGRQQLFTENTLTPILPLLGNRDAATAAKVARLWAVVLISNLVGALAIAECWSAPRCFHRKCEGRLPVLEANPWPMAWGWRCFAVYSRAGCWRCWCGCCPSRSMRAFS